jgi:hypothetical protein
VNDGTMNISEHISEQSNDQKTIKKNVQGEANLSNMH